MKVNHIKKGVNPSSVNQIYFTGDYLVKGFRIGVVAGMIALTVSKSHKSQPVHQFFLKTIEIEFLNPNILDL